MLQTVWSHRIRRLCRSMPVLSLGIILSLASCNKREKLTSEKQKIAEEKQRSFASQEEAGAAFYEAAKSGDQQQLLAIFGPGSREVLFTGDVSKGKHTLQEFVAAYNQMHRWRKIRSGAEVLYIGADNFPFPIPLGQDRSGQWYFDTAAGKDEILARRIGKDESIAIAACQAAADAEHQYFKERRDGAKVKQYAQKFGSDPGRQNGLYWPVLEDRQPSPLGQFAEHAKALGSNDGPKQFNGYYYRILTKQGDKAKGGPKNYVVGEKMINGFAILAYPAEYRESGIMSFIVGPDQVVYQKDLGERTAEIAGALTEYNPSDGWSRAISPQPAAPRRQG